MKRLLIIIVVGIVGHFLLPTSCEREPICLDKELPYLSLNSGVDFSKLSRADQEGRRPLSRDGDIF